MGISSAFLLRSLHQEEDTAFIYVLNLIYEVTIVNQTRVIAIKSL